nr:carbamoyltransferase N-terminal domain-containing protein [Streptomyces antimycoticus]
MGHDAAAALVIDGELVAAVEEERLSRVKKTSDFPAAAITWCLNSAGVDIDQVDVFAFPWRFSPTVAEQMISEICDSDMPVTAKFDALRSTGELYTDMLGRDAVYNDFVQRTGHELDPNKLTLVPHHLAHLMCGAYLAGGGDAAFLVSDGRAETLSAVMGELRNGVVRLFDGSAVPMTSSLGVAFGRITRYLGFVPNNDEYKVMGLAAYGPPPQHNPLLERAVRLHENGSYTISIPRDIGAYYTLFDDLFGGDSEKREQFDFRVKVAGIAQHMVEAIGGDRVGGPVPETGGVHGRAHGDPRVAGPEADLHTGERRPLQHLRIGHAVERQTALEEQGVQAGGRGQRAQLMSGPYLGPSYDERQVLDTLAGYADRIEWQEEPDTTSVTDRTAELLAGKNVVGWFQGRAEFGPAHPRCRTRAGSPA